MLSGTCMRSRSCWIASIGVPAAILPSTGSSRVSLAAFEGRSFSTNCGRNAPRPLAGAEVVVEEIEGNPGYYSAKFYLRPHYQLEGVNVTLSLTSKLPSAKAA